MSRDYFPIFVLAFFLLAVQLIALALTGPTEEAFGPSPAFEDPGSVWNSVYFIGIILTFTILVLIIIKLGVNWAIQVIILLTVFSTLGYVFYAIFQPLPENINSILTLFLSASLTLLLLKFPEWYVIDTVGILVGAGASSLFGISLEIFPVIVLLILLAIYDAIAVYKTRHMLALAEGVMDLKLPILLVVPRHRGYSFRRKTQFQAGEDAFFMGLGDAVMPAILVVSAQKFATPGPSPIVGVLGYPAIGAILGTLAGFALLMRLVVKKRGQAGLPFLNGGAILGFTLGWLLAIN